MKRISILGSTGSIGVNTLKVVAAWPERFQVVGLAAGSNVDLLLEQAVRFAPEVVSVGSAAAAERLRRELPSGGPRVVCGDQGLVAVATETAAEMVVAALVGSVGLPPTLAALEAGIDIALANKETLVIAGELMTRAAAKSGGRLVPLDSEHAALHQLLDGRPREHVQRLILTASGGPFRNSSREQLRAVTLEQALRHPTWSMGSKITIDSATLANKGLEVIEARWLFDIDAARIHVLVHPQSIVHALVEMIDGTVLAQLGVNDMRGPIQYALSYPERWPMDLPPLDLVALGRLEFEAPDVERFPCLGLAFAAAAQGGTTPAAFNAANEVANSAFRQRSLDFMGIPAVVEATLRQVEVLTATNLEAILETDRRARTVAARLVEERAA